MTGDGRWRPNATVATVVPRAGRYLMVEEHDPNGGSPVLNQPAGHLEAGESLVDAAVREVLEETRWRVQVAGYLGVARLQAENGVTYLRHTFLAEPVEEVCDATLDTGIIAAHWMTPHEIENGGLRLRSPLVLRVINLHLQGLVAPLSLVLDT